MAGRSRGRARVAAGESVLIAVAATIENKCVRDHLVSRPCCSGGNSLEWSGAADILETKKKRKKVLD
jgi:hypothetical protein